MIVTPGSVRCESVSKARLAPMDDARHSSTDARPEPIIQYWDTDPPPDSIAALLATFREQNPGFDHRVFSHSDAEELIRAHFTEREAAAFRACAVPAMQADYFRYCAVLAHGGIYSDADFRCAAPLRPLIEQQATGEMFCRPETHVLDGEPLQRVNNGFFVFREPGHPLLRLAVEIATANIEERICEREWGAGERVRESIWMTTGPGIFTLLHFLNVLGSFDRLVTVTTGTPSEPFTGLYCEVIGDYDRVAAAFEGVRVSPFEELWKWVAWPDEPLAYRGTDNDWKVTTTPIFR